MKFYLMMALLASCASYTDPEQEKITYYVCDKVHEVTVKHSDDYQSIILKYNNDQQVILNHFVTEFDSGYRTENLLWLTKGKKGVLIEKFPDGTETVLFRDCVAEKMKLQY